VLRLTRWNLVGSVPRRGILVGAPHTSNWDFIVDAADRVEQRRPAAGAGQEVVLQGPDGSAAAGLGGIPLDRRTRARPSGSCWPRPTEHDAFLLCIAAEGTRSKGEFWKPGFLRCAR
jgi:1-acyl-sn-glycerol-3-phosphate acyltransferase